MRTKKSGVQGRRARSARYAECANVVCFDLGAHYVATESALVAFACCAARLDEPERAVYDPVSEKEALGV